MDFCFISGRGDVKSNMGVISNFGDDDDDDDDDDDEEEKRFVVLDGRRVLPIPEE